MTKTAVLALTDSQARFLNELSRTATDYRGSCESIAKRANEELTRLNDNQWVSGFNHQILAEVNQEFGTLKTLLNLADSQFDFSNFEEGEERTQAIEEYQKFIKVALSENKGKHGSLHGGTWFIKNRTIADYETEK